MTEAPPAPEFATALALGAAVVGVTVGGGCGTPFTSGGGLVGATRLEPKTLTRSCCAAGWSTVSTSPSPPNAVDDTVGSVCACRSAGLNEWYVRARPMSSLKLRPSSMETPSWMEPMKAFTVSGFTLDLAESIRARMKVSWRWMRPKSLVGSECQYPLA